MYTTATLSNSVYNPAALGIATIINSNNPFSLNQVGNAVVIHAGDVFRLPRGPQFFRDVKKLDHPIFALRRLPARLSGEQAATLLGFEEHDIPKLVQKRILKPLGHPAKNCVKHFWLDDILDLAKDRDRLAKAEDACRRGPSKGKTPGLDQAATREAA